MTAAPRLIAHLDMDAFYASLEAAHAARDVLLAQDKFRLVMKLQPSDTMVVANQVSLQLSMTQQKTLVQ